MSDDLEYLARREREREQEEKREEQAEREAGWWKGEGEPDARGLSTFGPWPYQAEYDAWKKRYGYKPHNAALQCLIIVLVVLGLFIFAVVFGPCS